MRFFGKRLRIGISGFNATCLIVDTEAVLLVSNDHLEEGERRRGLVPATMQLRSLRPRPSAALEQATINVVAIRKSGDRCESLLHDDSGGGGSAAPRAGGANVSNA